MASKKIDNEVCQPTKLLAALSYPAAPREIWQEPFDYIRGHCERIASTSEPTDLSDFAEFFLDYQYMSVQEDLLRFAFPKALEAWARHELKHPDATKFKGDWHFEGMWNALDYRPIHPEFFNAEQSQSMMDFFVHVLLARMQQEKSLTFQGSGATPYEWIGLHATLVWQFPIAEQIWKEWWKFNTPEMAVCAIQWLSALIYDENDNPYFKPWTTHEGGGPPSLFETHHMKKMTAASASTDFIRSVLTLEWAEGALARAVEVLSTHESADQVHTMWLDISRRSTVFEERAQKLITVMERDEQGMVISWSDI